MMIAPLNRISGLQALLLAPEATRERTNRMKENVHCG
jgi:hypothetical protein